MAISLTPQQTFTDVSGNNSYAGNAGNKAARLTTDGTNVLRVTADTTSTS